jgi:hypothetical protein
MKIRSLLSIALVLAALTAVSSSPVASAAPKPTVLGTDPADDWGTNADPTLGPLGGPLGQELVEASIAKADAKTLNFIITVSSLPPWGGMPEISRYNWDFTAGSDAYQLTGGFTEYLRGVCNPLHTNSCPPPQDPGPQAFFVRQGPCTVGAECNLLGIVQATFDPATATITIPVPLALIKAKPGTKIGPGTSTFGGSIYAAPAALVSHASAPADIMVITKSYKVPK